jgi:hypothetical protein
LIRRTHNLAFVNSLLARDFPGTDFSELLAEPLHVVLIEGESGALFAWRGPGIYEAHIFFAVRGREAIDLMRRMAELMHDKGATLLWTLIPEEDRRTRMFARLVGWKARGITEYRHGTAELFVSER